PQVGVSVCASSWGVRTGGSNGVGLQPPASAAQEAGPHGRAAPLRLIPLPSDEPSRRPRGWSETSGLDPESIHSVSSPRAKGPPERICLPPCIVWLECKFARLNARRVSLLS